MSALLATAAVATAQEWTRPEPAKFAEKAEIVTPESADTAFYYLYLKEAKGFYCAGNSYGTQASVGENGLKVFFKAHVADSETPWDGKTITVNNWFKNSWKNLFTDSDQAAYVDCASQANYLYEIEQGEGVIRIFNSANNPVYNSNPKTQYLGLDRTGGATSTALYPTITDAEDGFEDVLIDWHLVSADEYENGEYGKALATYNAAIELGKLITDTKTNHPTVDIAAQEAVYANTASTETELKDAFNAIHSAIFNSIVGEASQDAPVNISVKAFSQLGIAYDFNDKNIIGWTSTAGADVNAANNGNAATDINATGNHFENWKNNALISGKIYATAKNLPAGMYKIEALSFAFNQIDNTHHEGVWFYANDQRAAVKESKITLGKEISLTVILPEVGDIEFGLDMPEATNNWVGFDNVYIHYYGEVTEDPNKVLLEEMIKDAESEFDVEFLHANVEVIAAYNKALEEAKSATGNYEQYLKVLNAAIENLDNSVADYASLKSMVDKALELVDYFEEIYPNLAEDIELFASTWEDLYEFDMTYTSTDIAPLNDLLDKTIADYISQNVRPGDDISVLIKNAGFDRDITGWNVTGATPAWGGISPNTNGTLADMTMTSGCVEVWRAAFDINQTIAALPAGVYTISCQALENDYDNTGSISSVLYARVSGSDVIQSKPLISIHDEATEEQVFSDGTWWDDTQNSDGKWIPAGMPGANYHFHNDQNNDGVYDYTLSLNVVLDETADLTFGISNKMTNRWAIFDNFRLVYKGHDLSAYAEIVETLSAQAAQVMTDADANNGMSEGARADLVTAMEVAKAATTAEEYETSIAHFREAIEYASLSVKLYKELAIMLDQVIMKSYESTNQEAVTEAETIINEIIMATSEFSCNNDEAKILIAEVEKVLVLLALPGDYKEATEDNPISFTSLIANADIEQGAGVSWIADKPKGGSGPVLASGINGQSMEYWCGNATTGSFDYHQSLGVALPEGAYKLTAKVSNSYSDLLELNPDATTTLGEVGLYAKVGDEVSYTLVPTQTALCTEEWQNPVVTFNVKEGQEVIVGVKNFDTMTARWTVIDDFELYYLGYDETSVERIITPSSLVAPIQVYDLQGRVRSTLDKGLNFVLMSDGSVRKVFVK